MRKKILFVILTFSDGGGTEVILSNLIKKLDKEKYEITILELFKGKTEYPKVDDDINIYSVNNENSVLKYKIIKRIFEVIPLFYGYYIRFKYIREKYDFEIACNFMKPIYIVGMSKGKKIFWIHGGIEKRTMETTNNIIKKIGIVKENFFKEIMVKRSDLIIPISSYIENYLIKYYKVSKSKIKLLYNGYDFKKILDDSKIEQVENMFDKKKFNIINVGRLDQNKNQILLLRSIKRIIPKYKNIHVYLIGDGYCKNEIRNYIRDNHLDKYVSLLGHKENVYPFIEKADLNVLTSKSEGFPTVLVEGLFLNVPTITTNVSGSEEIGKGKYLNIVDWDDKELSEKIIEIMLDYDKYKSIALESSMYIERFSLDNMKKGFENIIEEIVSN